MRKWPFLLAVGAAGIIFGTSAMVVSDRAAAKPCQNFDMLNPSAADSAVALAKAYPVHPDPNMGSADPAPQESFFDSVSCGVMFSLADRPSWAESVSMYRPPGYGCWGGFDFCDGLDPGPYRKVAKQGDTLRSLGGWDDRVGLQACVFSPKLNHSITPGPDELLEKGTIVTFC